MKPSDKWIPGVKKIAVLRANALGDYIFAQPALYALRSAYPQAEIVFLGKSWHAAYVNKRPGPVDRVIVVPKVRGISEPDTWDPVTPKESIHQAAEMEAFFNLMQAEQFDIALQMHGGGGNSNPFITRLGAKLTAGMRAAGAPLLDRWIPYIYWQHEVLRLIEVVGLVGAPPVMIEPRIEVTEQDQFEACQVLPPANRPLIVIHPGASDPRRRWSPEKFAQVGDQLARKGCQVALVGIPDEHEIVQVVLEKMHESAVDLCGLLSLNGLTGLLARAALVIANDSGPRHLSEAVGTPTVGIYWCGNLINAGAAFRAKHRPHLSWRLNCPICGKNTMNDACQHHASFVDDVSFEEVFDSSLDLLRQYVEESMQK